MEMTRRVGAGCIFVRRAFTRMNHFPQNNPLFRMNYYKQILEVVHREPTENVAVVEQGLHPHILFHGRRFKELFVEPTLVLSFIIIYKLPRASQTFDSLSDQLKTMFHQLVYKYMFLLYLKQPITFLK